MVNTVRVHRRISTVKSPGEASLSSSRCEERGALDLIARAGGGVVEAYPVDTEGKKVSASFLYNATRTLFESAGFRYDRPKGKNRTVMRTTVAPTARPANGHVLADVPGTWEPAKQKWRGLASPFPTYSATGGLRQGPGRASESPT